MAPVYKLLAVALSVAALGSTASCQSTTSGGAVGADRQQFLLVSSDELNKMAAQAYNKLQAESAKKGTLNTDVALTRRVRAIAARITPQTREPRPFPIGGDDSSGTQRPSGPIRPRFCAIE